MKRFSPREFALLCAPVLVVAVAGIVLSRRKRHDLINEGPLRLKFRVEKPTALEAFQGADAALNVDVVGEGADKMQFSSSDYFLEVQSQKGTFRSNASRGYSDFWTHVWKGNWNNDHFPINSQPIPEGRLQFGFNTSIVSINAATPPLHLMEKWPINRSQIQPFPFGKMVRSPLVVLRWVKVTQAISATGTSLVHAECVFDLTGAAMSAQTPVDFSFSEISGGIGWGTGMAPVVTAETSKRRVRQFNLQSKLPHPIERVTGRVSADNRWPLAFQIEPFDLGKVKVGQHLKFKSWPAPMPAPVPK